MPLTRGRLITIDSLSPAQYVVPVGKSGEGYNPFAAPSKWSYSLVSLVAGGPTMAILPAVSNRAVRLFRVISTFYAPAGFPYRIYFVWGAFPNTFLFYDVQSAAITAHFREEFGPTGISFAVGTGIGIFCTGFNVSVACTLQYSLEVWGAQDDGN